MTGYDPDARRDTPLALKLKDEVRQHGPISLGAYMTACLADPEHGYYSGKTAIGQHGDFITAPEISQVFGELLGLWSVVVWKQMGSPASFNLIELGPGRGTMLQDALRAAAVAPDFLAAVDIYLIEINPALRDIQQATLSNATIELGGPRWFERMEDIRNSDATDKPTVVIGNEFLDTFPLMQFVRSGASWSPRCVTFDELERLQFSNFIGPKHQTAPGINEELAAMFPNALEGQVVSRMALGAIPAELIEWPTVAALFIDYGQTTPLRGDGLQAVRNHVYEHPLTSPGEADLSALVDFHDLVHAIQKTPDRHLEADGPITQAEFLGRLGMMERASRLMAANPASAAQIETGIARLMSPQGMGARFKAIGVRSSHLPVLPGFA